MQIIINLIYLDKANYGKNYKDKDNLKKKKSARTIETTWFFSSINPQILFTPTVLKFLQTPKKKLSLFLLFEKISPEKIYIINFRRMIYVDTFFTFFFYPFGNINI